ncbi:MAG: hypothetical protein ACLURV_08895 [Gallintestinimicrobium sp.]
MKILFVKGMTTSVRAVDAGAMIRKLMLNDVQKEEKFYQGKAGSACTPVPSVTRHENSVRELFPDASIAMIFSRRSDGAEA